VLPGFEGRCCERRFALLLNRGSSASPKLRLLWPAEFEEDSRPSSRGGPVFHCARRVSFQSRETLDRIGLGRARAPASIATARSAKAGWIITQADRHEVVRGRVAAFDGVAVAAASRCARDCAREASGLPSFDRMFTMRRSAA